MCHSSVLHVPLIQVVDSFYYFFVVAVFFVFFFFFFNDTATTEIYTLSLHDALPICGIRRRRKGIRGVGGRAAAADPRRARSEEHTSELQSPCNLVCRLLLEKKKKKAHVIATRVALHIQTHHHYHTVFALPLICDAPH